MPTGSRRINYQALAAFRHRIRRFLRFSERASQQAGLEPQQHQLLLAVKGAAAGCQPTIGFLAEWLQIQHHSAVELVNRSVRRGLIRRRRMLADRRKVVVALTNHGEQVIRNLSASHLTELRTARVQLLSALQDLDALPINKRKKRGCQK